MNSGYNVPVMHIFRRLRESVSPKKRGSFFYLSLFLATGSFFPFLNLYYRDLGFSGRQIGFIATIFPIVSLVFTTPISAMADRKHWRIQLLQVAIAGEGLFIFLLKFPRSVGMMSLTLTIMAMVVSPVMSVADSLIATMATNHRLKYGGMRLWGSIGFAISASIFGLAWQLYGFSPMFLVGSFLMVPLFVSASSLDEGSRRDDHQKTAVAEIFRDGGLAILILVSFLMGISNSLSMSFEGILVRYLGAGNSMVGVMIAVSAVSEILTMQFGENLADRLGKANALILALGILIVAYVGYVLARTPVLLVPMAMLRGLGFGLFFTNIVRAVNDRSPSEWVTTTHSMRSVAMFSLAPLFAGPLGGMIHDAFSPSAIFILGGVSLSVAVTFMWVAKSRRVIV